jgi:uncharacterized protein DUF5808
MTRRLQRVAGFVAVLLGIAAVVKELRTPADQRTGHGTVAGFVPYDFRAPTPERVRDAVWAPDDPRILKPHAFGVGWTINLGRVVAVLRGRT